IFLYIADVPIFWLPIAVFPQHAHGRTSGIIPPNYSTVGSRGFGLTHLGYYQVFNEYFDAQVKADIYTKGGYHKFFGASFMKRYILNGPADLSLAYSKTRYSSTDPYNENFRIGFNMNTLNIDPVTTLGASLDFESANGGGYSLQNAQNVNDVLKQDATSN